jgi:hypothetical protein
MAQCVWATGGGSAGSSASRMGRASGYPLPATTASADSPVTAFVRVPGLLPCRSHATSVATASRPSAMGGSVVEPDVVDLFGPTLWYRWKPGAAPEPRDYAPRSDVTAGAP